MERKESIIAWGLLHRRFLAAMAIGMLAGGMMGSWTRPLSRERGGVFEVCALPAFLPQSMTLREAALVYGGHPSSIR